MAAIDELKTKAVLVYVDNKSDKKDSLPKIVRDALKSDAFSNYLPKVVITDPDLKTVICNIPMQGDRKKRKRMYRDAKKKIREWFKTDK